MALEKKMGFEKSLIGRLSAAVIVALVGGACARNLVNIRQPGESRTLSQKSEKKHTTEAVAKLSGSGEVAGDGFGTSIAISGNTIVVGMPGRLGERGRVYLFTATKAGWRQTTQLSGAGALANDGFGFSVAMSGRTIIVGAIGNLKGLPGGEFANRAEIFRETNGVWKQSDTLKGPGANDTFGYSVAISGSTAIVGTPNYGDFTGQAYLFRGTQAGFKLTAEFTGAGAYAGLGISVATSGLTAVIGVPGRDGGRAYVLSENQGIWTRSAELTGSDTVAGDSFGYSVAISGASIVVGAPDHAGFAGRAYVFRKLGASWKQVAELRGSGLTADDEFGASVAISGSIAVVGAYYADSDAGRAFVFKRIGNSWKQVAELQEPGITQQDEFGSSVAVSGVTAVVGAPLQARQAGAAYVFQV